MSSLRLPCMECDVADGHDPACPVLTRKYHEFEVGLHDYWDGKASTSADATYTLGRHVAAVRAARNPIRKQTAAT